MFKTAVRRALIVVAIPIGVTVAAKINGSFSISGNQTTDSFAAPTFIDFDVPGAGGDFSFTAELSGDFAGPFAAGNTGTITDLGASPVSGVDPFITATSGGTTVEVALSDFSYSGDGDFILGTGTGTIRMTGFDDTPAEIVLASFELPAGLGFKNGEGPWFATVVAVPEPTSALLFTLGALMLV